ncbi:MAG: FAD-binding oxidoreductase [Cyanobacteriota bacterium]|nr:FAD-binding oxidoreductase [Cyanobacteriota bacterium]
MITPEAHELPELVRDLHRQAAAWQPAGLGHRLSWGPPLPPGITTLSTTALNGVVEHSPGDFTITVRAGTPLAQLQAELADHQQWLALDPAWGAGDSSLGGLVARGLSGGYRLRHLGVRDQLIGITLLRADGTVARAGGRVVKNVAGYDLMRLFCGSWGSLGLITELTLRTQPLPPHRLGLLVQGELGALTTLAGRVLAAGLTPERLDHASPALAAAANQAAAPSLLIGLASLDATSLQEQASAIDQLSPLTVQRLDPAALDGLQHALNGRGVTPAWLLRLGVPASRAGELLANPALAQHPVQLAAGDGLGMAWGAEAPALTAAGVAAIRRHCQALGGWLTLLRQPPDSPLPAWLNAPSRPLIEAIKHQFDPLGQLAPGRLPGVEPESVAPRGALQGSRHTSGQVGSGLPDQGHGGGGGAPPA